MLELLAARQTDSERIEPADQTDRPAGPHAVAILATTPALRAGLESMVNRADGVAPIPTSALASGDVPAVLVVESRAWEQLVDLTEQWPGAGLLFVGEPGADALDANRDRVTGAVSTEVDAIQLGAAIHAVASGLRVFDPVLSERTANQLLGREPESIVENPLTPRERQVLEMVARGYPNKSIAYELGISEHTAKFHVGSLLTKLEAASRAEVVTNATRRGLLSV